MRKSCLDDGKKYEKNEKSLQKPSEARFSLCYNGVITT